MKRTLFAFLFIFFASAEYPLANIDKINEERKIEKTMDERKYCTDPWSFRQDEDDRSLEDKCQDFYKTEKEGEEK